eukprot:GHRR01015335.1.p4 GENE.GHRR01015335.1~~GHRR01015335.1.p4  ORF type:complete len:112 (+),score=50.43 GHRR01015335.1:1040-1375(+)
MSGGSHMPPAAAPAAQQRPVGQQHQQQQMAQQRQQRWEMVGMPGAVLIEYVGGNKPPWHCLANTRCMVVAGHTAAGRVLHTSNLSVCAGPCHATACIPEADCPVLFDSTRG